MVRKRASESQARFRLKEKFDVPCVHCERGVDDRQRDVHGRVDGARRKTASFEEKR
jgi:hypothetical protein